MNKEKKSKPCIYNPEVQFEQKVKDFRRELDKLGLSFAIILPFYRGKLRKKSQKIYKAFCKVKLNFHKLEIERLKEGNK